MTEENPTSFPCKECLAGVLHLRHVTYFTWVDEELVSVPNFPAWVCDVCGRREYDLHALNQLNLLLNSNAGRSPHKVRRAPRSPAEPPNRRSSSRSHQRAPVAASAAQNTG